MNILAKTKTFASSVSKYMPHIFHNVCMKCERLKKNVDNHVKCYNRTLELFSTILPIRIIYA